MPLPTASFCLFRVAASTLTALAIRFIHPFLTNPLRLIEPFAPGGPAGGIKEPTRKQQAGRFLARVGPDWAEWAKAVKADGTRPI